MLNTNTLVYRLRCGAAALLLVFLTACASVENVERQTAQLSDQLYELLAGEIALKLNDKQQSLEHYYQAALLLQNEEIYSKTIALAVSLNDYQKARVMAEQWYRIAPQNTELNQVMVLIYLQSEDYRNALERIEFLVAQQPNFDAQQLFPLLGTLEFEKSREILAKLEQAAPQNAAVYWLKAYLSYY